MLKLTGFALGTSWAFVLAKFDFEELCLTLLFPVLVFCLSVFLNYMTLYIAVNIWPYTLSISVICLRKSEKSGFGLSVFKTEELWA